MRPWFTHRGSPDGSLPSQPTPGHVRARKALAAGALIATVAAMGTLATGGAAQAALAPGTPVKTLTHYNLKPAFAVQAAVGESSTLTLTNPGPQHGIVGVPITPVTLTASDPNPGATLIFTSFELPAGLSGTVSGSSVTISGTPTAADIGTSNVVITVLDGTGGQAQASFPWTISTPTLSIINPGPQHGTVGVPLSITLTATDTNAAATITWSLTGLPAGLSGLALTSSGTTATLSGTPTTAGSTVLTVSATDSTGATASVSFTLTIAPATSTSCHVTYSPNNYPGGFTANITLANTGTTAINGWTLQFVFPGDQKITNTWNGTTTQTGQNVSITNMSYNATIPANGTTTLGFQGTWTSSNTSPASFTVNGATCT